MNVLQIHYIDRANNRHGGGGAISMYRLHSNLRKAGVDSRIMCREKTLTSYESVALPDLPRMESALKKLTSRVGLNDIHCLSTFKIKRHEAYLGADILNFHCIHGGFFNYLALPSLTRAKPAVFTLRDVWGMTGHCAVNYDCDRWKNGCGNCPYPQSYPPIKRDATHVEWKLKEWVYKRSNLTIVTLSNWLTREARQSMLNHFPIYHIPNGVDTGTYRPRDARFCRALLGIAPTKKVLMFAALSLNQFGKGSDLLIKALQSLPESLKGETVLLLVGEGSDAIAKSVSIDTRSLGYVRDHRLKAVAYCAADLFVLPTRAEALPNTVLESIACGTPCVSFNVGGVPDLVRPGMTGYLAQPEDAADLCAGIVQLLEDENLRNEMSQRCRSIAVREFSQELEAERYIALYRNVLGKKTCVKE